VSNDDHLYQLLEKVILRDEQAFARLYDLTVTRAYGVARGIVKDDSLAEDVLAEAYLKIWQQAPDYDRTRGGLLGWILIIVRSKALDILRRRQAQARIEEKNQSQMVYNEFITDIGPADLLNFLERDSKLQAALLMLTNSQRQLLALAFFRDLTHSEIARYTGLPLGTVKTTLRTSLIQLRSILSTSIVNLKSAYER